MELLDNLPDEVVLNIFSFFNKRDHGQASIVNKHFYKVSTDQSLNNLPWPLLDYNQPPFQVKTLIDNKKIYNFVITPNGRILFDGLLRESDNFRTRRIIQIYDIKSNECQKLQHLTLDYYTRCKLFPLSNSHIILTKDSDLKILDIAQERCIHNLTGHTGEITALTELPNGYVVSAAKDNTLKVWDIEKGECLSTIKTGYDRPIEHLITLSTGLVGSSIPGSSGTIGIWDITLGKRLYSLMHHKEIRAIIELPTGELLSKSDDSIKLWDVLHKTCLDTFKIPNHKWMVILPNKKQILMAGTISDETDYIRYKTGYWIWDIRKRKLNDPIKVNYDSIKSLAVLPNGHIITILDNGIQCWFFPELRFENEIIETDLSSDRNNFSP